MKTSRKKILRDLQSDEGPGEPLDDRAAAQIDLKALKGNYEAIRSQAAGLSILPMIKANAYGHGAPRVAQELAGMLDLYALGVATLQEGREVREALGSRFKGARILIFSGALGWTDEKGKFCEKHGLTPVIASDSDWDAFLQGEWAERISYELEFNTGMNRLGLRPELAPKIAQSLRNMPAVCHPDGVLSHLALAEDPDSSLTQKQITRFKALRAELEPAFPKAFFHLGNSAAIWNQKHLDLKGLTDVVRPGLSLYGIPPWPGAPLREIRPVLSFQLRVAQIRHVKVGETVGYGGAYKNEGTQAERVAILSGGYADGINRRLSPKGQVWLGGRRERILGRISMDLMAVSCQEQVRVGDWAEILGQRIEAWEQAKLLDTIPYELLTSISARVQRKYVY